MQGSYNYQEAKADKQILNYSTFELSIHEYMYI